MQIAGLGNGNGQIVNYFNNVVTHIQDEVTERLESDFDMFVLELEHLGYHVRQTIPELMSVGTLVAEYAKEEYMAKRQIKQAEALALSTILEEARIQKRKKPTIPEQEAMICLDPRVVRAHHTYAEKLQQLQCAQAVYDTLKRKNNLLPGMQGRANKLFESTAKHESSY